jgi:hypothetical protein
MSRLFIFRDKNHISSFLEKNFRNFIISNISNGSGQKRGKKLAKMYANDDTFLGKEELAETDIDFNQFFT